MRVAVVGTGYVGLVTGTCLSDMGNAVVCHDTDHDKIARLSAGEVPIYEPGLAELVRRNVADGRLSFSPAIADALEGCEVAFIAVGTPPDSDGAGDRRFVLEAAESIARAARGSLTIAIKSTVPVGTGARVQTLAREILDERGEDYPVEVASNPEFLKEGRAVEDFMRPDRIVVGTENAETDAVMRHLYDPFLRNGHPYLQMDIRSAEMTKYAANAMLATRISLMNEIASICDQVGADIMDVRRGIGTDKRIGMDFLYPGIGFGGSCFPKDVQALARMAVEADSGADILDAVDRVNKHQKVLIANRLVRHFGEDLSGRRIALWGLAFKPLTDDVREAPALTIIRRLTSAGATVCAYDPEATDNARAALDENGRLSFAGNMYEALDGADALVLATEWQMFRRPDFGRMKAAMKSPLIFDGRNQYEPGEMKALGFEYHCIGRPQR